MKADDLPMRGLGDARLAVHAAGHLPAWLWGSDGTRILWANPVGARLLGAARTRDLTGRTFGPADPHRRQVSQLARRLRTDGPARLERLRGFGAALGRLVTCGCTKLTLDDGSEAILIVAVEAIGRPMPLGERLQRLVEDADIPLAAFGRDGVFIGASDAARAMLGFRNLSEAGLDNARDDALRTGRNTTPIGVGHLVLQRVGSGADIGLIALLEPGAVPNPLGTAHAAEREPEASSDSAQDQAAEEPPAEFGIEDALPQSAFTGAEALSLEPFPDFTTTDPQPDLAIAEETISPRTIALRFVWEIDSHAHFSIGSDDLLDLVGVQAAASLDAPWQDVATAFTSYGRMASAIASRAAWSGISLSLPVDGSDEPLMAELSGIPTYTDGEFAGYRGFGMVHDLDALTRIEALRQRGTDKEPAPQSLSAHSPSPVLAMDFDDTPAHSEAEPDTPADQGHSAMETPANVVHFRASEGGQVPVLTPVENNAFNELARELSARLEADRAADERDDLSVFEEPAEVVRDQDRTDRGARALFDLAPVPIAVYRNDRVLFANAAFVTDNGYDDLAELQAASFDAAAVAHARRVALEWDDEPAEGLIVETPAAAANDVSEDLAAILDVANDAILMFDAQGRIRACNRRAASLFGTPADTLIGRDLAALFTPDTQVAIAPLRERLAASSHQQTVDARTVVGGQELPLKMTMGRARPDGLNFFAIVRDVTLLKRDETDLAQARRQNERASADKADILARISHEMRAPLGAIIGFADVMIEQRFGPLGSDRYVDYLRDIRGCGERVVAIVDDLLDLSRIESGKRDLALTSQDLNHLVEQCVATMQPQANRERIIIRSSLAHPLPPIVADGESLKQIALNLIGNSIHLASPGGQVIVSTVYADSGDVLLRVRDTGHGLNDNDIATALAPFRPADSDGEAPAQIRLSLTRALAEANHAKFSMKPAPYAGTLIEVAFPPGQMNR